MNPPSPVGRELDPQRVKVSYSSETTVTELAYDPDCASGSGWHYDDPEAPSTIHLCPAACETVQGEAEAELAVAFACEVLIPELW